MVKIWSLVEACVQMQGGAVATGYQQLCLGGQSCLEAPTEQPLLAEHAGVHVTTAATPLFFFLFFF